jgi:hypothetical protein
VVFGAGGALPVFAGAGAADAGSDGCALAVDEGGVRFLSGVFDDEDDSEAEREDADGAGDAAVSDVITGSARADDGSVVGLSAISSTIPETVPTAASSALRNGCFFLTGRPAQQRQSVSQIRLGTQLRPVSRRRFLRRTGR